MSDETLIARLVRYQAELVERAESLARFSAPGAGDLTAHAEEVERIANELALLLKPSAARQFAEAAVQFKHAADAGERPAHARWALDLYRECQRDAEADPWYEPGGAERRFIARLREYAGGGE